MQVTLNKAKRITTVKNNFVLKIIILISIIVLCSSSMVLADNLPKPGQNYYYDETNILSDGTKKEIDDINKKLETATESQIIVAVVDSIEDYGSIEEYATKFFEKWKIGSKEKNNGILFVTSLKERKVRIEVGYGLEGALPDGKVGRILDDYVMPNFEKEDYNSGILNGFRAIVAEVQKEYNVESLDNIEPESSGEVESSDFVLIVLVLIIILFAGISGGGPGGRRGYRGYTTFGGSAGRSSSSSSFGGFSGGGGSSGGGGASRGW